MLRFWVCFVCLFSIECHVQAQAVGAEACKKCHLEIYQDWSRSAHAKAQQLLPYSQRRNPYCLSCHVDPLNQHVIPVETFQQNQAGVSCEACHGYAYQSIKKGIKQKWWTLKYGQSQKKVTTKQALIKKRKMLAKVKQQAKTLGLKRGDNPMICQRCHDGISSKLLTIKWNQKFRHDLSIHTIKKKNTPILTHPL